MLLYITQNHYNVPNRRTRRSMISPTVSSLVGDITGVCWNQRKIRNRNTFEQTEKLLKEQSKEYTGRQ